MPVPQLLANDGALEDEVAGEQRLPRFRRLAWPARRVGRAAGIDGDRQIGLAGDEIEGQRIDEAAVDQHAAVDLHRLKQDRQRHAGGDRLAQRTRREHDRFLRVEIRRDDLQRDGELVEVCARPAAAG